MDLEDFSSAGLRERALMALLDLEEARRDRLLELANESCMDVLWENVPEEALIDYEKNWVSFSIDTLSFRVRVINFGNDNQSCVLELEQPSEWKKIVGLVDLGRALRKQGMRPIEDIATGEG